MTFGRPSAIPEDYIKIDLPLPLPSADGELNATADARIGFFNATM
jgi:hypothetical protein